MRAKLCTFLTSLILAFSLAVSGSAFADPDLPKPPKPGDLPHPDDLPGVNTDEGTWWDPLGLFSDDDDDHHRKHGKHHGKHHKKHHKHKKH